MNRVIVGIVVIAGIVAGYFAAQAAGLFGGGAMNEDEVKAWLAEMATEINEADGGLKYDDWSKLTKAVHMERQITIRGESLLNKEQLNEGYIDPRQNQAAGKLCEDDTARAALEGGARLVYNWWSADGEELGMVDVKGADWCASMGY